MATSELMPANDVLFAELCLILEKLRKKSHQEQDQILSKFINNFRVKVANISGKKKSTFFPILRLLLPDKDRERSAYNLKQKKLAELLVKVLSLSKSSKDADKLLNFRSVSNASDSDFAGVAYYVFKSRVGTKSSALTVGDINHVLDKIASAEVGNKGPILDEAFSYVIRNLTPEQLKWFLRLILKDLKLGMGVHRTLAAFHPDAPELYDSCGNLVKVCEDLEDGDTRPLELGVQVFYAISPMLSERLDVIKVPLLPQDRTYQIESKFDGERFQMHMKDGVFEYFSRKGHSYADNYGKTYDSGLLTPLLKDCFSASVTSFILDGEMMGWHKYHHYFGSKGMAFDVKKITENSRYRPCFCVFDLLYYNGQSLVGPAEKGGKPLSERLKLLSTMFRDVEGVIQHSKVTIVQNRTEILDALNKAIEDQDEGIVVKDTGSYYIANRRNAGWYKIKPEYTDKSMSDMDLVIIGADDAENKRQGRAKNFYVACSDIAKPGDKPHRWICVGKVAIGVSYEEREKICALLEKKWVPWKRTLAPPSLVFNKEKPDYWILPEHSIALQVRATELIRSTNFATEYTLRFPRIIRIRDDKPVDDVMTLDEFNSLAADKRPVVKLGTKRINEDQLCDLEVKVRRNRTTKVPVVPEQFRSRPAEDIPVVSKALQGREICVLSGDNESTKQDLVKIVLSHGGKHVENVGKTTWCSIAGRPTVKIRNYIKAQELDIITSDWLRSLPNSESPCFLSPVDMVSMKKSTRLALSRDYDEFGDSYTTPVDEETLKKCFKRMCPDDPEILQIPEANNKHILLDDPNLREYLKAPAVYLTKQEMLNIDKDLFGDHNPFSYLRPCTLHFVREGTVLELRARMYGATTCKLDSPKLTHIIVPQNVKEEELKRPEKNVPVVYEDWISECLKEEKLIPENDFIWNGIHSGNNVLKTDTDNM